MPSPNASREREGSAICIYPLASRSRHGAELILELWFRDSLPIRSGPSPSRSESDMSIPSNP